MNAVRDGPCRCPRALIPFRPAVPFWGQMTWNWSDLSLKRNCSFKGYRARTNPADVNFWSPPGCMVLGSAVSPPLESRRRLPRFNVFASFRVVFFSSLLPRKV